MSMIKNITLEGTTWRVSGTKRGFTPFLATFHQDGKVSCITVNKNFEAVLEWSENGDSFHISGEWPTPGGNNVWNLIGVCTDTTGTGHYSIKWESSGKSGTQIGSFTMTEKV